jgi:hypothetical protein
MARVMCSPRPQRPSSSSSSSSSSEWPIVLAPGDYNDGESGGMKTGRGNRSTRRKPAPPQIPLDQARVEPGRRGGKPATNRLSYGAAKISINQSL